MNQAPRPMPATVTTRITASEIRIALLRMVVRTSRAATVVTAFMGE